MDLSFVISERWSSRSPRETRIAFGRHDVRLRPRLRVSRIKERELLTCMNPLSKFIHCDSRRIDHGKPPLRSWMLVQESRERTRLDRQLHRQEQLPKDHYGFCLANLRAVSATN